jgi:hypothetical protein
MTYQVETILQTKTEKGKKKSPNGQLLGFQTTDVECYQCVYQ